MWTRIQTQKSTPVGPTLGRPSVAHSPPRPCVPVPTEPLLTRPLDSDVWRSQVVPGSGTPVPSGVGLSRVSPLPTVRPSSLTSVPPETPSPWDVFSSRCRTHHLRTPYGDLDSLHTDLSVLPVGLSPTPPRSRVDRRPF